MTQRRVPGDGLEQFLMRNVQTNRVRVLAFAYN